MKYDFTTKSNFQEYFGRTHDMVRRAAKEFVDKEIVPYVDEWEEAGEFPRELYKKSRRWRLPNPGEARMWPVCKPRPSGRQMSMLSTAVKPLSPAAAVLIRSPVPCGPAARELMVSACWLLNQIRRGIPCPRN